MDFRKYHAAEAERSYRATMDNIPRQLTLNRSASSNTEEVQTCKLVSSHNILYCHREGNNFTTYVLRSKAISTLKYINNSIIEIAELSDEALLDQLQHAAFNYFVDNINPISGLVSDTSRPGSPVSIAVVGFALSCFPVGVERGWIDAQKAIQLTTCAMRFFWNCDQSGGVGATGYKGFYYHFLDPDTGIRVWQSELSMIDTALLISGMLTARSYFNGNNAQERELRDLAEKLYLRVNWRWSQGDAATIRMGWKPECGFLHYGWDGYNESLILYALACGSPSHPITNESYKSWTATYQWENIYGQDFLYAGPLFVHQFSHGWIDFRNIRDRFMREKNCDYFENSRRAVMVQREYAKRNPERFIGYCETAWGLTACEGPAGHLLSGANGYQAAWGYAARGVPFGPDDGTIGASAVLASLPFAPDIALNAVRQLVRKYPKILPSMQFASGFNPSCPQNDDAPWTSPGHFGLDQGIVVMMVENYRSELIWKLMRDCAYIGDGLRNAGFRGGWLS